MLIFDYTQNPVKPQNPRVDTKNSLNVKLASAFLFSDGSDRPVDLVTMVSGVPSATRALIQNGQWGRFLNFNNASSIVSNVSIETGSPFTVSARVRSNALAAQNEVFSTNAATGSLLRLSTTGIAFFSDTGGGGATQACRVDATDWHTYTVVFNGITVARFYVDGVLVGTGTGLTTPASTALAWGAWPLNGSFYNGSIDYGYFWKRELSAGEVDRVFNDPFCLFIPRSRYFPFDPNTGGTPPVVTTTASTLLTLGVG